MQLKRTFGFVLNYFYRSTTDSRQMEAFDTSNAIVFAVEQNITIDSVIENLFVAIDSEHERSRYDSTNYDKFCLREGCGFLGKKIYSRENSNKKSKLYGIYE